MFKQVTVIGDGGMGTVCSMLLCENKVSTILWGHDAAQLQKFAHAHENIFFLAGYKLPEALRFESDDAMALKGSELLISAVPCQFVRAIWTRLKPHVAAAVPVLSVTKGVENGTLLRPSQIIRQVLGGGHALAVLSGPNIADELAQKLPATTTIASDDPELVNQIRQLLNTPMFRVYTNDDVLGVEIAGAMKNVIAIAAGIIDGIGAGNNAKAALITRGLAEIQRLGLAVGAREKTFNGLSGLGDLVTTCISPSGRNRSFGERIGRGQSVKEAVGATKSVVEGVATCRSIVELARRHNVEMPITEAVYDIIEGHKTVREAINDLMTRQLKAE
ncbi:MAG: NAD(P)-dependent glycerol-3-phosphate dehydrogenase [Planctomycetaceae bacterium]|nr:NAD(P)-dependent glycerol-3-phosphate dehydrogenase [Planctomycetaceae bacterium]